LLVYCLRGVTSPVLQYPYLLSATPIWFIHESNVILLCTGVMSNNFGFICVFELNARYTDIATVTTIKPEVQRKNTRRSTSFLNLCTNLNCNSNPEWGKTKLSVHQTINYGWEGNIVDCRDNDPFPLTAWLFIILRK